MIEIRQAKNTDIKLIEDILITRIDELANKGIIQWTKSDVIWKTLTQDYCPEDFFLLYFNGEVAGCFCVVDFDPKTWINDEKGKYLYIHKIVVLEKYSHQGVGDFILQYFKDMGRDKNYKSVKLDVRDYKKKLRVIYERNGFVLDHVVLFTGNDYHTCLYRYDL